MKPGTFRILHPDMIGWKQLEPWFIATFRRKSQVRHLSHFRQNGRIPLKTRTLITKVKIIAYHLCS